MFNEVIKGNFEVFSTLTGTVMSAPMPIDEALDELDRIAYAGLGSPCAANNAIDIRRAEPADGE